MNDIPDKSTFASLYSGQPPWTLADPEGVPRRDRSDHRLDPRRWLALATQRCSSQAEATRLLASTTSITDQASETEGG